MIGNGGVKSWQWAGPKYRRRSILSNGWPTRLFDEIEIKPDTSLFHAGSSDRELTHRLLLALGENGQLVETEFDVELYEKALRDPRFSGDGRIIFFKEDTCAPTSSNPYGPFDIVFCHASIEQCPNLTRIMARFIRLAKQGGLVYFEMAAPGDLTELYTELYRISQTPKWADYFKAFYFPFKFMVKNELKGLLVEAGFGEIKVEEFGTTQRIPINQFANWLASGPAWPFTDAIPTSRQGEFAESVADGLFNSEVELSIKRSAMKVTGKRLWGDLKDDLIPGRMF